MALRERPTARQISGVAVAFAGLVLIVLTIGHDLTVVGFCLAMGSAISWGIGNVLLKRIGEVAMLDLIVWLSLVPPLPALALSLVLDGPMGFPRAIASASGLAIAATLYKVRSAYDITAFSADEARRITVETDPIVEKAIDSMPKAKALLETAKRVIVQRLSK